MTYDEDLAVLVAEARFAGVHRMLINFYKDKLQKRERRRYWRAEFLRTIEYWEEDPSYFDGWMRMPSNIELFDHD